MIMDMICIDALVSHYSCKYAYFVVSQFLASILMLLRDDFLIYIPEGEMHHFSTFLL